MKIESLSLKTVTILIFTVLGVVAVFLSQYASTYFRQAALEAQINSLSRVIDVASKEVQKEISRHTLDLGMKLAHNKKIIDATGSAIRTSDNHELVSLLDDPFIHGFVGFAKIDLVKIRVFDLELEPVAQSKSGLQELNKELDPSIASTIRNRPSSDRLKAINKLWISTSGPLYSTLVPLGGLRPVGFIEIIANPVFNLTNIGDITQTPLRVFSMTGKQLTEDKLKLTDTYLPVEFILTTSDGSAAYKIVGYEHTGDLDSKISETQSLVIGSFLAFTLILLLVALWLFSRFLFLPVSRMISDIRQISLGRYNLTVCNKGLKEFHILANAFNAMNEQVRLRTHELQHLLDLDISALMCFDDARDPIYFNRRATNLFGYDHDEASDLALTDLFADDIDQIIESATLEDGSIEENISAKLLCKHKDGHNFQSDVIINVVNVVGKKGLALALTGIQEENEDSTEDDQRLNAVEHTLSSLLAIAIDNPGFMSELGNLGLTPPDKTTAVDPKSQLREQAVKIMNLSLACWMQDLGKTKLDMAEESKIWPVYIDKSTPTTRTLDKYLNIETCPKNPRNQRVMDTAEFVLRKTKKIASDKHNELQAALDDFRRLLSGAK